MKTDTDSNSPCSPKYGQGKKLCNPTTITTPRPDNKKWKIMKPFNRKVGKRYVAKMPQSCPKLEDEILPWRFGF